MEWMHVNEWRNWKYVAGKGLDIYFNQLSKVAKYLTLPVQWKIRPGASGVWKGFTEYLTLHKLCDK